MNQAFCGSSACLRLSLGWVPRCIRVGSQTNAPGDGKTCVQESAAARQNFVARTSRSVELDILRDTRRC